MVSVDDPHAATGFNNTDPPSLLRNPGKMTLLIRRQMDNTIGTISLFKHLHFANSYLTLIGVDYDDASFMVPLS